MTARQHHYVPQFYLKGFAKIRKKPKLFCFDFKVGKPFETAPENVAVERDFNRVDIEGFSIDAFEKLLAEEESIIAEALARIIQRRSISNEQDRDALFGLISTLAVKSPRMRESMRSFHEQTAKVVMDLVTSSKHRYEHQIKLATEAGYVTASENVTYESMRDFIERGEYTISVANEANLYHEATMEQTVAGYIRARKWMLLKAPEGSPGFITSDHPAALMWSDPRRRTDNRPPGHGLLGTQILFPISSGLAMLGAFEIEESEINADETLVAQVNGSTIIHATRQVYGSSRDFCYILTAASKLKAGVDLATEPWLKPEASGRTALVGS